MKNRFYKFLLIVLVNIGLLVGLLSMWSKDCLREKLVEEHIRLFEGFEIALIGLVSLLAMAFVGRIAERIQLSPKPIKNQLLIFIIMVLVVSSFKYISYTTKTIRHFQNQTALRQSLCEQITTETKEGLVTIKRATAKDIDLESYELVHTIVDMPTISKKAQHIDFELETNEFGDHYFVKTTYKVPIETPIKIMEFDNGNVARSQSFEVVGDYKLVTYSESR